MHIEHKVTTFAISKIKKNMTREIYKEKVTTEQGRKELHEILLNDIKAKFETLVNGAPEANKEHVKTMLGVALEKMQNIGVADLYDFFAGEHLTTKQFISYTYDLLQGKLFNK